jgi:hypothetical protein
LPKATLSAGAAEYRGRARSWKIEHVSMIDVGGFDESLIVGLDAIVWLAKRVPHAVVTAYIEI